MTRSASRFRNTSALSRRGALLGLAALALGVAAVFVIAYERRTPGVMSASVVQLMTAALGDSGYERAVAPRPLVAAR